MFKSYMFTFEHDYMTTFCGVSYLFRCQTPGWECDQVWSRCWSRRPCCFWAGGWWSEGRCPLEEKHWARDTSNTAAGRLFKIYGSQRRYVSVCVSVCFYLGWPVAAGPTPPDPFQPGSGGPSWSSGPMEEAGRQHGPVLDQRPPSRLPFPLLHTHDRAWQWARCCSSAWSVLRQSTRVYFLSGTWAAAMLGVFRGVGQQPLRGVLALYKQSGKRSDELMLHSKRHDPLGDLPLLGSCWS